MYFTTDSINEKMVVYHSSHNDAAVDGAAVELDAVVAGPATLIVRERVVEDAFIRVFYKKSDAQGGPLDLSPVSEIPNSRDCYDYVMGIVAREARARTRGPSASVLRHLMDLAPEREDLEFSVAASYNAAGPEDETYYTEIRDGHFTRVDASAKVSELVESQRGRRRCHLLVFELAPKGPSVSRDGAPRKARPASAFFALDARPALEEDGHSLGEIGASRRPVKVCARNLHFPAGRALGKAWGELSTKEKEYYEKCAADDKVRYAEDLNFVAQSASHLDSPLSWLHPSIGPRTNAGDGVWSVDATDDERIFLVRQRRDETSRLVCGAYFTVGLPTCIAKSGEKYYYEVTILTTPRVWSCQFGWARRGFEASTRSGCGDDAYSYACDGHRRKLWHQGTARDWNPDASWKAGDVVGCMLDLESREICFSVNGAYDEPAFRDISVESAYFPALTMGTGTVAINVGARAFKHRPDGYRAVDPPPLLPDSMIGCLSDVFPTLNGPTPAPKPLTGAAALLETLDKFKAKNGGVDDPYYAAMRSALEELEIEEREEGS